MNRIARFLLAGAVNTAAGFVVYAVFVLMGAPAWLALILSMPVLILINFRTIGNYVFRDGAWHRLPSFVLCYAIVYAVDLGLIRVLEPVAGGRLAAQAVLSIPIAALSYVLLSRFVYGKAAGTN